jgi:hypothetical protein
VVPGSNDATAINDRTGLDLDELAREDVPIVGSFTTTTRVHRMRVRHRKRRANRADFPSACVSRHNVLNELVYKQSRL